METMTIPEATIVIKENIFDKNFSIFGGNAVHIKMRRPKDLYSANCAGVHLEANTFTSNFGLQKSNGGAVSISCTTITSSSSMFFNYYVSRGTEGSTTSV